MKRWLAGLAIAVGTALLPAVVSADEPPANATTAGDRAGEGPLGPTTWSNALDFVSKSDSGFDKAGDAALKRARNIWKKELVARQSATLERVPKLKATGWWMTQAGRVGAWERIIGAWWYGDRVGMAQDATNAYLGDVVAGWGAVAAIALLPASASVAVVTVFGVAGAVLASTAYDELVGSRLDAAADLGVDFARDLDAMNQRIARARIWVADADRVCADARRALADARRAVGEASTAEETVRWLEEERTALEGRLARARELAARARESASPAEVAAENAGSAERAEGLATDAAGYADEACRIADEMAGTRQEDALRIWNRADRYLDRRASSVTADAAVAVDEARDRAARVGEINALRREATAAAAQAASEAAALDAQVAGGRARLEQAASEVRRSALLLQEATAATEDCHSLQGRALALLDKSPWNTHEAVRRVLDGEVRTIDPPFVELEALADAVPDAEAAVARATRRLEALAAAVADLKRELAAQVPAPDPGATARAADAAARAEAAHAEAERSAGRAASCAERARGLAEGGTGETQGPASDSGEGGWERVGGIETVGSATMSPLPAAPGGPTLDDLLSAAETAYARCNFAAASEAIARARALAPGDAQIAEIEARIAAKAERQSAAIAALQAAEQALARGARKDAVVALQRAADAAPDCFTQQVSAVSSEVRSGLGTQRKEADQRARSAVGGLLGTMIGVWNAGMGAAGGATAPGAGGADAGGSPPGSAAAGAYCSINGAPGAAELFLLLRQRPSPQVTNYVIVATTKENAAAAASGSGMEIVSRHTSYGAAVAAARQACPNPVQGSF